MNFKTTAFAAFLAVTATQAHAFSFSDVQFWTGTGSNQSALAIQWNDGRTPQAFVWGFRYNGSATAETMLQAIVAADPGLYGYFGTPGAFGLPVYGLGYDQDGSGVTGAGFNTGASIDAATAVDPTDRWQVGWATNGFWALYEGANGTTAGGWASAQTGVSGSNLANNSWRALSFAAASAGWSAPAPTALTAAPVPEPATLAALGLGVAALLRRRRR